MKYFHILYYLIFSVAYLSAHPINDECNEAIDLGILPYCETTIYSNIDATTSEIGEFNIGEIEGTGLCAGTLFDSGGNEGNYGINENHLFTICPTDFHRCIAIEIENYAIEAEFDRLTVFEGMSPSGTPLLSIDRTGQSTLAYATSECITVQFTSDPSQNRGGFKLNWQCLVEECPEIETTTCDNPVVINQIPFTATNLSTCFAGNDIEIGPCGRDDFLSGQEYIFAYDSPGGECISVNINGVIPETGISILKGCPESGEVVCINQKQGIGSQSSFTLSNITLKEKGTYYFLVANEYNCTPFDIEIFPATTCPNIFPSASACENALVLNGCNPDVPTALTVELGSGSDDFFKFDVNNGCWEDVFETNYTWFTFEAQADGEFAFLVSNNDPDGLVDVDFNIWGPFDDLANACEASENSQPIRSSWADDLLYSVTGLANINPELGTPVTNTCEGALGEGFVKPLLVKKGEVYVVLLNDFDGVIFSGAIAIDFAGTTPGVLTAVPNGINFPRDTFICETNSINLITSGASAYEWSPTESLSCRNCTNPVASPTETTTYTLAASTVCTTVSKEVTVEVIKANAGIDQTVCQGAIIQLNSEIIATAINYNWSSPSGIENLSCTNCPNPTLTANSVGSFDYILDIQKSNCLVSDTMTLTVIPGNAPVYSILDNQQICLGDSINLGGETVIGQTYEWTNNKDDFTSNIASPKIIPTATTTYFLKVSKTECSLPAIDSVTVEVNQLPIINVGEDTIICQATPISLGNTLNEIGVTYEWITTAINTINNPNFANAVATPLSSSTYTLTATNGSCQISDSIIIEVQPIEVAFTSNTNFINLCLGETLVLNVTTTPSTILPQISTLENSLDTSTNNLFLQPITNKTYIASISNNGCTAADTVVVKVDSLPLNMEIMPSDTTICLGNQLILSSPIYESKFYPEIQHQWSPNVGFDSPDSFYNLVITPTDTIMLTRINRNGVCLDTSTAIINVLPFIEVPVTPANSIICEDETIDLIADLPEGAENIAWSPSENISCVECPIPTVSPIQTTTYTLSGTFMDCPLMGASEVVVTNFSGTTLVNLDTNIIFIGQSVDSIIIQTELENIMTIEWREDGQLIEGANNFILSYVPLANASVSEEVRTVRIEAMITTAEGCVFFLETSITVLPPTVPNVFTPGNDGLNDYFTITLPEAIENLSVFRVYNRWGTLMYDNETPEKGWDGSLRNNRKDLMPSGVYVYLIQYKIGEKMETVKGNVTLIR